MSDTRASASLRRTPPPISTIASAIAVALSLGVAHAALVADPELRKLDDGPWSSFRVNAAGSSNSSVTDGLRITRSARDPVSVTRGIPAGPTESVLIVAFDVSVSTTGATAGSQNFRIGGNFRDSYTDEPDAATFARLALEPHGSTFRLRDPVSGGYSRVFEANQAVTWVLNHTATARTYAAPNGTTTSLAPGRMDVWVGREHVFSALRVVNPAAAVQDFKWYWGAGTGTTTFGFFALRTDPPGEGATAEAVAAASAEAATPADPAASESATLELYRPSPNPFESTMRFAYAISGLSKSVNIGIYDVAGRKVRSLAAGLQSPGRYEVSWNGAGDDGAHARAGVYFLRASIGADDRVVRVVYLRK
jgi:hypothetical protein